MAITTSAPSFTRARRQFEGLFSEMFVVSATLSFAAIAAAAEDTGSVTVTGLDVSKGDMVVSLSFNADCEPNIFQYAAYVTADNTLELTAANLSGVSDTPGPTKAWFLIGRPLWDEGS